MNVFYGEIILCNTSHDPNSLNKLKENVSWESSINNPFKHSALDGGFLLNSDHSYRHNDLYYLDARKDTIVLFSGNLFNKSELIQYLPSEVKYDLVDDAELISALYHEIGEKFVDLLNGDFAIIIYNFKDQTVHLFRDHLGIRPLAYFISNSTLYFSTDVLGLCKAFQKDKPINQLYLLQQFSHKHYWDYRLLPNKNVNKVLPAHFVVWDGVQTKQYKYWRPDKLKVNKKIQLEQATDYLKSLVKDAVKIRCDKRYKASSHVSGGFDSGIIAKLVRQEYLAQSTFHGFSWSPEITYNTEISDTDERYYVNLLCNESNILPVYFDLNVNSLKTYFSNWRNSLYLFEEYELLRKYKAKDVNLIFSGWGGDEFISIGHRGIDSDLLFSFDLFSFLNKNRINKPLRLLNNIVRMVLLPALKMARHLHPSYVYFSHKYIKKKFRKGGRQSLKYTSWLSRKEVHLNWLANYHLASRTEDWAINGIRNGVEYRYPFLDKRIIEYMITIPSKILFKNGQHRILIKEIAKDSLSEQFVNQQKKVDSARFDRNDMVFQEIINETIENINEFKENLEFDFFDFQLFEKDLAIELNINKTIEFNNYFAITLLLLRKRHEFIKGYLS